MADMAGSVTQRWLRRSPRWRRVGGADVFEPDRYEVAAIPEPQAAAFIREHHYASTLPSTTYRFGMFDHGGDDDGHGRRLVGVATLGVPMTRAVLTGPFPTLVPYVESLEFSRLVLLDAVPANGESWFTARVLDAAASHGVRGVVTFADPVPRWRTTGPRVEMIKPGHVGIVYQALNFEYAGRGTRRSLVLLPDATVLTARALAKVTGGERGAAGVIARLVELGAPVPSDVDQPPRLWLRQALATVGARRIRHPGNHRYLRRIGSRSSRSRTVIGLCSAPYPKPDRQLSLNVS